MLILCIGTKISPNFISPTARVAHQEVVGGAISNEHAMPGPEYRIRKRVQCARSSARSISRFLVSLGLDCCTPFTASLASAMAEGDSSDDRGPARDRAKPEVQCGSTTLWADRERRSFEYQVKQLHD